MGKALVVVHSWHHGNTEKIAGAIAGALDAEVKFPQDIRPEDSGEYSLIGLGAGIDSGRHYAPLLDWAGALPPAQEQSAFIFSTAGVSSKKKTARDHSALREILLAKGYAIVGEFACRGYNTNSVLKHMGGMNRGRPNEDDLQAAADFAHALAGGQADG